MFLFDCTQLCIHVFPGGLICRAILERYSVPVKSFISLSSPQAGQFGGNLQLAMELFI